MSATNRETDREAQARELASELEWRFRLRSDTAPAQTFGDCMTLILAYGDRCRAEALTSVRQILDRLSKPAHTYASENADHYRGFDAGVLRVRQAVDALPPAPPREEPEG